MHADMNNLKGEFRSSMLTFNDKIKVFMNQADIKDEILKVST